jgi:hypothetical protein
MSNYNQGGGQFRADAADFVPGGGSYGGGSGSGTFPTAPSSGTGADYYGAGGASGYGYGQPGGGQGGGWPAYGGGGSSGQYFQQQHQQQQYGGQQFAQGSFGGGAAQGYGYGDAGSGGGYGEDPVAAYAQQIMAGYPGSTWEQAYSMAQMAMAGMATLSAGGGGGGGEGAGGGGDRSGMGTGGGGGGGPRSYGMGSASSSSRPVPQDDDEEEYAEYLVSSLNMPRGSSAFAEHLLDFRAANKEKKEFEAGLTAQGVDLGSAEAEFLVARREEELRLTREQRMNPQSRAFRMAMEDWEASWYESHGDEVRRKQGAGEGRGD